MIIYYYLHDSRHSKHKKQLDRAVNKNNDCHLVTCFATTVTSAQDMPSHRGNIRD